LIKKTMKKRVAGDDFAGTGLSYWLSKSPGERIEAVEILRKQFDESTTRLQRTVRIIKRARS
jgi:hypothetical protein